MRSPANRAARLFDDYFIRKQESGRAVVELHEQHAAPEIIDRAQNARLFAKSAQPLMITYRLEQSTAPPDHRLEICTFHAHYYPSTGQAPHQHPYESSMFTQRSNDRAYLIRRFAAIIDSLPQLC